MSGGSHLPRVYLCWDGCLFSCAHGGQRSALGVFLGCQPLCVSHWPGPSHTAWTGRSVSQITTCFISASLALGLQADVTSPGFLCVCWGLNSGPWFCIASTYWPSHIPCPGERFCLLIQCLRYRSVEIFCFFLGQFLVSVFLGVCHFHPGIFALFIIVSENAFWFL